MPDKIILTVTDLRDNIMRNQGEEFRVKKVTGSIDFKIGQTLPQARVQDLCSTNGYTVHIVGP